MGALTRGDASPCRRGGRSLHLPTIRRLYRQLEERAEAEGLGYCDFLAILVAEEIAHRGVTRIQRAVRKAKFPVIWNGIASWGLALEMRPSNA